MAPFEHVYWNLLFRSNKSGDPSFDSLWCVCACGQLMHLNVIMNRCALVTSVRFMILCIATHHHSTNSYEPIRFLQTSQNRLINIHRKSPKHISQSALFGFSKNIGHDQGGVSLRCSYEPLVGTQLAKSSQRTDRSHLQFVNLFH